jgi:hypothetical protein
MPLTDDEIEAEQAKENAGIPSMYPVIEDMTNRQTLVTDGLLWWIEGSPGTTYETLKEAKRAALIED